MLASKKKSYGFFPKQLVIWGMHWITVDTRRWPWFLGRRSIALCSPGMVPDQQQFRKAWPRHWLLLTWGWSWLLGAATDIPPLLLLLPWPSLEKPKGHSSLLPALQGCPQQRALLLFLVFNTCSSSALRPATEICCLFIALHGPRWNNPHCSPSYIPHTVWCPHRDGLKLYLCRLPMCVTASLYTNT